MPKTMKLYEAAVLYLPAEEGKEASILVPPFALLASSDKAARTQASFRIPRDVEASGQDLDDVEVLVRPFV